MHREYDILVIGAGIVGVSVAIHLQRLGKKVALFDRREPGEETSFGNAGIIARSSVVPLQIPSSLLQLSRYALNASPHVRVSPAFLPRIAPWLLKLAAASKPQTSAAISRALNILLERAVIEHKALMSPSGAYGLLRETGWLKLYRSSRSQDDAVRERALLEQFEIGHEVLDAYDIRELEPHLAPVFTGGTHIIDSASVADPSAVVKAYARLFVKEGGTLLQADAKTFRWMARIWRIDADGGMISAPQAVIALGPWSMDVLAPLGYDLPFAVERGYHMHYAAKDGAVLGRPVYDADIGYLLAPMERGIRLTTGIEFANRDARPTPRQLAMVAPRAREIFPIDKELDDKPWLGRRPSFPDSLPIIGPAVRHRGLWAAFGHGHIGFTLGPVTGRLLAQMITGEDPMFDPQPYSMKRFVD